MYRLFDKSIEECYGYLRHSFDRFKRTVMYDLCVEIVQKKNNSSILSSTEDPLTPLTPESV